ncbi:MAG: hypothetical protein JNJ54_08275 [Myxococcaceae bacterium]|nr:hypothetical protein [Myxococcaceae bacterium]
MFVARRLAVLSLTAGLLAALWSACDTVPPCAKVKCDAPRVCNPSNGTCELPAGYDGGGTTADAGLDCATACTGATPQCDRATGRCVQCLTSAHCACPTPVCQGFACVDAVEDGGITPSETCAGAPTVIACGPRVFDVDVNLATKGRDVQTTCAAPDAGGADVMFNVLLGVASDLRVSVAAGPGGAQPVAALRRQCSADVDLACVDSGGIQGVFRARRLQPGVYTLVLQGYDRSGSGPTLARVEVAPPTGSTNETCLQAQPLPLDGGTTRVDLIDADDDVQLSCNPTVRSPELFYGFTLPQTADVVVNATAQAPQQPVMALWTGGCRTPSQQSCSPATSQTGRLVARRLPAGDYTLVVETPGAVTMGRIELTSTASPASVPPSNDSCALPRDLSFPAGMNELSQTVDTSLGTDDTQAPCGGAGSPDQVFRLSVPTTALYTFTATPEAGSNGVPVLSLRRASCAAMTSEQCAVAPAPDQPASFSATLAPDTYYVWLDATQPGTAGRVTLSVRR